MADSTAQKGQIQDDLEHLTELDHKELLKKQKDESMSRDTGENLK